MSLPRMPRYLDAQTQRVPYYLGALADVLEANAIAKATADLTLTASFQDVAGATLTLAQKGNYLIWAVFDCEGNSNDTETEGRLDVAGVAQAALAYFRPQGASTSRATVAQMWRITTTSENTVIKLQARTTSAAGTFKVRQQTQIMSMGVG